MSKTSRKSPRLAPVEALPGDVEADELAPVEALPGDVEADKLAPVGP